MTGTEDQPAETPPAPHMGNEGKSHDDRARHQLGLTGHEAGGTPVPPADPPTHPVQDSVGRILADLVGPFPDERLGLELLIDEIRHTEDRYGVPPDQRLPVQPREKR